MSRRCSPKTIQHQTKYQLQSNTNVKLCHSKIVPSNKISLSYSQCFNVSRVRPLVIALFPTSPFPEVPLAGRLKFFYLNWATFTQDPNILNIVHSFEIPFLYNPVQGKSPYPPVLNQKQSNKSRRNPRKCC